MFFLDNLLVLVFLCFNFFYAKPVYVANPFKGGEMSRKKRHHQKVDHDCH